MVMMRVCDSETEIVGIKTYTVGFVSVSRTDIAFYLETRYIDDILIIKVKKNEIKSLETSFGKFVCM